MNFKVTFLDDEEFERLPYRDTHTSLGLADSHKNEAYVRRTGVNAIDVFTAMHELEHLQEREHGELASHNRYGDGVYYKGFFDIFTGGGSKQQQAPPSQPYIQQVAPMAPSPNVVQPGLGSGAGPGGGTPSADTIQRLKGFFSGGNPNAGF